MYEGSEAAWKPNRCAPIAMITVAAPATRDGSMLGRVSITYAARAIAAAALRRGGKSAAAIGLPKLFASFTNAGTRHAGT